LLIPSSDGEFDAIFGRIKASGLRGSTPRTPDEMRISDSDEGRLVFFREPDVHLMEVRTRA
jgi:hypothetical protein